MMCWSPTWPCLPNPHVSCWWAPCARILEAVLQGQPLPPVSPGRGQWGELLRPEALFCLQQQCEPCSAWYLLLAVCWQRADAPSRQAPRQPWLLSPPGDQHSLFPHQRASARPQGSSYCSRLEGCLCLRILGRPFISKMCLLILSLAQLPEIMSRVTLKWMLGVRGQELGSEPHSWIIHEMTWASLSACKRLPPPDPPASLQAWRTQTVLGSLPPLGPPLPSYTAALAVCAGWGCLWVLPSEPEPPPLPTHKSRMEAKPGTRSLCGEDSGGSCRQGGTPSLAGSLPPHHLPSLGSRTNGRKRLVSKRALTSSVMWATWRWTRSWNAPLAKEPAAWTTGQGALGADHGLYPGRLRGRMRWQDSWALVWEERRGGVLL